MDGWISGGCGDDWMDDVKWIGVWLGERMGLLWATRWMDGWKSVGGSIWEYTVHA